MAQKLSSFSDKIVKKVKTQMKTEHLESTLKLKAYFKMGMPKSLIPKMKPGFNSALGTDMGATIGEETHNKTTDEPQELDLNLIKRAISLLPAEVLPNCILAMSMRDSPSGLI